MSIVVGLLLKAFFILVIAKAIPGVRIQGFGSALGVAVVYAVLSWLLKGLLVTLSLPFIIVTFGMFMLVVNGFLLWITDKLLASFEIKNLPAHILATVGITVSTMGVDHIVARLF
ncbi:MAG: phage holin family protein [Deltaproteobacteria bacterium]